MESRNTKNLQDLLKLAIQHQKNDAVPVSDLDPEKKMFLENVLKSMTVNVMEELLKTLQILDSDTSTPEEKNKCLNVIRDYIDDIDYANSFVKVGGTDVVIKCVKSTDVSVRANAYNVLAEMAQNNPYCQNHLLLSDYMENLISTMKNEDETVLASCLYALSSLVNSSPPALTKFIKNRGIETVLRCLHSESPRVFTKTCYLISSLSSQFPTIMDEFMKYDAFKLLAQNLEVVSDFDVKFESLVNAMASLTSSEQFLVESVLSETIKETLQCSINNIEDLPQCEEMTKYSQTIINKLN